MKRTLFALLVFVAIPAFAGDLNEITPENVIRLMNDYRAAEGLPPLAPDERLGKAAGDRMHHMEDEGYWAHESPDGLTPFVWVKVRAYDYAYAGENLACGFETAKLLVQSWMESPGHRANILSRDFEDCGIAIIDGSTLGPASGKSIVVLFGKKRETMQTIARRGVN